MPARIRKGDRVVLLSGKDKGKSGIVHGGAPQGAARAWSRAST